MPLQFSPSAGYRRLDSWTLACIAQMATCRFCQKFLTRNLDPTGRQYDQMTQAARSGKVNIVEGSARASTSRETEMKLTDVARASLAELHSDYEDWLLRHGQVPWRKDSPEAQAVYNTRLDKPDYGNDYVHDSCIHILAQQKKFAAGLRRTTPASLPTHCSLSSAVLSTCFFANSKRRERFLARPEVSASNLPPPEWKHGRRKKTRPFAPNVANP